MSDISSNNKRIAKNTVMLYIRMFVTMCISLYTSRVILQTLGVEDYGVYNVVGGFVTMFGILTTSLSASISRFVTVELGKGDIERQRVVFSTSIKIQLLMSLIIIVVAECVGTWFIMNQMQIPEGRLAAAQWVFHCSIISFVISLLTVPFSATIIAHEHMSAVAYIGILDAILKLSIVYILTIVPIDKLIFYAILMVTVHLLVFIIYVIYSKHKFSNSIGHSKFDKKTFKEMWGFAGWSFLGNSAYIFNTQGVNMVMNVFFGVVVNAARGIANQIDSVISQFANNFTIAFRPQITKLYAAGEKTEAFILACRGAKFSFLLMYMIALPIILEINQILHIWLGTPPENSAKFAVWAILASLTTTLGNPLLTLINANGDIKKYQIYITLVGFLPFPLTWIAYKLGGSVILAYVIYFIVYYILVYVRLWLVHEKTGIPYSLYLREAVLRTHLVAIIALILPLSITMFIEPSIIRLLVTFVVSVLSNIIACILIGFTKNERKAIFAKIENIFEKITKR